MSSLHITQLRPLHRAACAPTALPQLFNPYRDRDTAVDLARAPAIRRTNLRRYLAAQAALGPGRDLWLAEAPGATGTRRSGLPLIDEYELELAAEHFGVRGGFQRPTRRSPAGKTATSLAIWAEIDRSGYRPVLWNVLPHHPYRLPADGRPANRPPRRGEARHFLPLVGVAWRTLCSPLGFSGPPPRLIAIGRFAERAARKLGLPHVYVRHPAQAGLRDFREAMRRIYPDRSPCA